MIKAKAILCVVAAGFGLLFLTGCGDAGPKLSPAGNSEIIPEAKLMIASPQEGEILPADQPVSVVVSTEGFELGAVTEGAAEKGIAHSKMGQHVHIIVDNEVYKALYQAGEKFDLGMLPEGTHTIRAFLSRSWHESLKNDEAFKTVVFHVGRETGAPFVLGQPLLTYSRPKGTYTGDETERLMVDYWVNGIALGDRAYKVRLTVDGKTWDLTEWQPYYIEGLKPGDHAFKLELIDPQGQMAPGLYNSTERTVTIAE